jgi:hypothetical protein
MPRAKSGGDKIQLWRAWSAVPEVIALSKKRRNGIAHLMKDISAFVQLHNPARSFAAMLVAGPGWGKSFLVKQLAHHVDAQRMEFNITHLATVNDLIACFDAIASHQNQNPDKPLVVFWDEINAPLESNHVYSYFLGPMWDGTYRRAGLTFMLRPIVWLFAGTDIPSPSDNNKSSDFLSRLSVPPIDFKDFKSSIVPTDSLSPSELKKEANRYRLEQMYTAVSLIRRIFPDVQKVSVGLLEFMKGINPKYGTRSMEFMLNRLRYIQHGVVRLQNLPIADELAPYVNNTPNKIKALRNVPDAKGTPKGKEIFIYDKPQSD